MVAIGSSSSAPAPPSDGLYTPPHSSLSALSLCFSLVELVLGHHAYHKMLKYVPLDPLLDDPIGLTLVSESNLALDLDRGRGLQKKEENQHRFQIGKKSPLEP
jgi:hypothetical protein